MPVDRSLALCWSCGLDPRGAIAAAEPADAGAATPSQPATVRWRLIAGGLLLVAVVVAGSLALLSPADRSDGVRGIAARLRGGEWHRAEVRGASADFPAAPVRQAVVPGSALARAGESLVAERDGLRTELLVVDVADAGTLLDGGAVAEQLAAEYAATAGGRVVRRTPLYLGGAPGLDAVVDGRHVTIRIRATVSGTTAYVMAVTGPQEGFQRFTESFRRAP